MNAASLKNIGEKTANLFDRKKKEMGDLASEKAAEAQAFAEENAKKADEAFEQTKKEAGDILAGAGKCSLLFTYFKNDKENVISIENVWFGSVFELKLMMQMRVPMR